MGLQRATILVVDDEPAVLAIVERVLQVAGYNVISATDRATAVDLCKRHGDEISLALLDFLMPDISNPALVECLKSVVPAIRIAIMSGYSQRDVKDRDSSFERYPFIQKPFMPADLVAFVETALKAPRATGAS